MNGLADSILTMVWAFDDKGRKDEVRRLANMVDDAIAKDVEAAVKAEREACAKVAEISPHLLGCDGGVQRTLADDIAKAIRARGGK